MRMLVVAAALAAGFSPLPDLSPSEVQAAIAEGVRMKDRLGEIGVNVFGEPGGFDIAARGPRDRVVFMAASAAARGQRITLASIPPEFTVPLVFIAAVPKPPVQHGAGWKVAQPATGIVVLADGQPIAPVKSHVMSTGWSTVDGRQLTGAGIVGRFDLRTAPGALTVIVATATGERRYEIAPSERARLR